MVSLVHPQSRLSARCYPARHETTDLRASALGRRARGPGGRSALVRRLRPPPLPDPTRELSGRERLPHRPLFGLRPANRAHRREAVQRGGPQRGTAQALFPTQERPGRLPHRTRRAVARVAPPEPEGVRQADEPLDARDSGGGESRGGPDRRKGNGRDCAGDAREARGALDEGQAVDHEPRPRVRPKKGAATG